MREQLALLAHGPDTRNAKHVHVADNTSWRSLERVFGKNASKRPEIVSRIGLDLMPGPLRMPGTAPATVPGPISAPSRAARAPGSRPPTRSAGERAEGPCDRLRPRRPRDAPGRPAVARRVPAGPSRGPRATLPAGVRPSPRRPRRQTGPGRRDAPPRPRGGIHSANCRALWGCPGWDSCSFCMHGGGAVRANDASGALACGCKTQALAYIATPVSVWLLSSLSM